MKIESLYCRCNEREDNPLDHYLEKDCGACAPGRPEAWPLEWIQAILKHAQGDTYHAEGRLTATRILGCPRETAILDNLPIVYDVRKGNSTFHGTLMHRTLEANRRPGTYAEVVVPPFEFGGYLIEGKTDKVTADFKVIKDWKGHSERSQGFKYERFMKGKPDREGAAQLNLYRIGIAKAVLHLEPEKYRPTLILQHGANTSEGGEPWFQQECPIMTEAQILAMHPFDDEENPGTQPYTVAEIMQMLADFERRRRELLAAEGNYTVNLRSLIAEMPLVGKNVWAWRWNKATRRKERLPVGDKCKKYCLAWRACKGLGGEV